MMSKLRLSSSFELNSSGHYYFGGNPAVVPYLKLYDDAADMKFDTQWAESKWRLEDRANWLTSSKFKLSHMSTIKVDLTSAGPTNSSFAANLYSKLQSGQVPTHGLMMQMPAVRANVHASQFILNFVFFKTPISAKYPEELVPKKHQQTPEMILERINQASITLQCKLGLVIPLDDATYYYDMRYWCKQGIDTYLPLGCELKKWKHENPPLPFMKDNVHAQAKDAEEESKECRQQQFELIEGCCLAIDQYCYNAVQKGETNVLVGIHCMDGYQRTGFLKCYYEMTRLKLSQEISLRTFKKARPFGPNLFSSKNLLTLQPEYWKKQAKIDYSITRLKSLGLPLVKFKYEKAFLQFNKDLSAHGWINSPSEDAEGLSKLAQVVHEIRHQPQSNSACSTLASVTLASVMFSDSMESTSDEESEDSPDFTAPRRLDLHGLYNHFLDSYPGLLAELTTSRHPVTVLDLINALLKDLEVIRNEFFEMTKQLRNHLLPVKEIDSVISSVNMAMNTLNQATAFANIVYLGKAKVGKSTTSELSIQWALNDPQVLYRLLDRMYKYYKQFRLIEPENSLDLIWTTHSSTPMSCIQENSSMIIDESKSILNETKTSSDKKINEGGVKMQTDHENNNNNNNYKFNGVAIELEPDNDQVLWDQIGWSQEMDYRLSPSDRNQFITEAQKSGISLHFLPSKKFLSSTACTTEMRYPHRACEAPLELHTFGIPLDYAVNAYLYACSVICPMNSNDETFATEIVLNHSVNQVNLLWQTGLSLLGLQPNQSEAEVKKKLSKRSKNTNTKVINSPGRLPVPEALKSWIQYQQVGTPYISKDQLSQITTLVNALRGGSASKQHISQARDFVYSLSRPLFEQHVQRLAGNHAGVFSCCTVVCPHPGTENGGRVIDECGLNQGDDLKVVRVAGDSMRAHGVVCYVDSAGTFCKEQSDIVSLTLVHWITTIATQYVQRNSANPSSATLESLCYNRYEILMTMVWGIAQSSLDADSIQRINGCMYNAVQPLLSGALEKLSKQDVHRRSLYESIANLLLPSSIEVGESGTLPSGTYGHFTFLPINPRPWDSDEETVESIDSFVLFHDWIRRILSSASLHSLTQAIPDVRSSITPCFRALGVVHELLDLDWDTRKRIAHSLKIRFNQRLLQQLAPCVDWLKNVWISNKTTALSDKLQRITDLSNVKSPPKQLGDNKSREIHRINTVYPRPNKFLEFLLHKLRLDLEKANRSRPEQSAIFEFAQLVPEWKGVQSRSADHRVYNEIEPQFQHHVITLIEASLFRDLIEQSMQTYHEIGSMFDAADQAHVVDKIMNYLSIKCELNLKDEEELKEHHALVSNLVTNINSRLYFVVQGVLRCQTNWNSIFSPDDANSQFNDLARGHAFEILDELVAMTRSLVDEIQDTKTLDDFKRNPQTFIQALLKHSANNNNNKDKAFVAIIKHRKQLARTMRKVLADACIEMMNQINLETEVEHHKKAFLEIISTIQAPSFKLSEQNKLQLSEQYKSIEKTISKFEDRLAGIRQELNEQENNNNNNASDEYKVLGTEEIMGGGNVHRFHNPRHEVEIRYSHLPWTFAEFSRICSKLQSFVMDGGCNADELAKQILKLPVRITSKTRVSHMLATVCEVIAEDLGNRKSYNVARILKQTFFKWYNDESRVFKSVRKSQHSSPRKAFHHMLSYMQDPQNAQDWVGGGEIVSYTVNIFIRQALWSYWIISQHPNILEEKSASNKASMSRIVFPTDWKWYQSCRRDVRNFLQALTEFKATPIEKLINQLQKEGHFRGPGADVNQEELIKAAEIDKTTALYYRWKPKIQRKSFNQKRKRSSESKQEHKHEKRSKTSNAKRSRNNNNTIILKPRKNKTSKGINALHDESMSDDQNDNTEDSDYKSSEDESPKSDIESEFDEAEIGRRICQASRYAQSRNNLRKNGFSRGSSSSMSV